MKSVIHRTQPWEEITHLFSLLALLCVTATGALLLEAQRLDLWHQADFMQLLGISATVSALMVGLGMASALGAKRRRADH